MTKNEFLDLLRDRLQGLPQDDIDERLSFYSEMIDDRIEEGVSEQDAVLAVGDVETIVSQIVDDIPLLKIAKAKIKSKRRMKAWETILLVLGSPIWLALCIAAFAVIFSLYISIWAVIISLWSAETSFIGAALGSVVGGIIFAFNGNPLTGVAIIGAGVVLAGLSIFFFYVCKAATKGTLLLTKKIVLWTKNCFIKKEEA